MKKLKVVRGRLVDDEGNKYELLSSEGIVEYVDPVTKEKFYRLLLRKR